MDFRAPIAGLVLVAWMGGMHGSARAADPNEGGAAAAESLFQEARKLTDAKRYSEACPKFLASQKLAPAVGTLLNLADCYEKAGQLASAWARFHEAIALAQRLGRADREKTARERADKLEPRLIRLTILSADHQADVKLDGNVLDPAVIGTGLPVDPGKHTIEATAKGKVPFSASIDVSDHAKSPSIEIPELDAVDEPKKAENVPPEKKQHVQWNRDTGQTQRVLGLVAMGVGVVGAGVGTYFGLRTSSRWSEAKEHCDSNNVCDATGVDLATRADNAGLASTIGFAAGGAFLVGGVILYFTAPSGPPKTGAAPVPPTEVRVGFGPGSVALHGSF